LVKLNEDMKEVYRKNMEKLFAVPMATTSADGVPNVAPMASVWLEDDETFWIGDNFMVKTLENLKANSKVALYFWDPETKRCLQVKGDAERCKTTDACKITDCY
jgi:predicted pyridoxine 5'-phosphate oxidase superfamily flavin-nucleotide-binding protein